MYIPPSASQPTSSLAPNQANHSIKPTASSDQFAASMYTNGQNQADRTTISAAAHAAQAKEDNVKSAHNSALLQTNQGEMMLNIEAYFSPHQSAEPTFQLPPLLLPSQQNVDNLSHHISMVFPDFLADHNIPSAPDKVTYDTEGKMQLPADYPYAQELKDALAESPSMARVLSTVNALTSHVVEMKKSIPFQEEYAATSSKAQANAVIDKYSHLFWGNRSNDTIALTFSNDGLLTMTANGKPT